MLLWLFEVWIDKLKLLNDKSHREKEQTELNELRRGADGTKSDGGVAC